MNTKHEKNTKIYLKSSVYHCGGFLKKKVSGAFSTSF